MCHAALRRGRITGRKQVGMKINITYKDSVRNAPPGYKEAVQYAVRFLEHAFTDPITINLAVGFNEVKGDPLDRDFIGESWRSSDAVTYDQIRKALGNKVSSLDDVIAWVSLPQSQPIPNSIWGITTTQAKALGIDVRPDSSGFDGEFALRAGEAFTYDPDNRLVANHHDAIGLILHEITEIMGRWQYAGAQLNPADPTARVYSAFDLYRYLSPGVRSVEPGSGYLSFDGQSMLQQFDDARTGFDAADWARTFAGDAFGANGEGVVSAVTALDMRVMDILGFHRAPSPRFDLNGDAVADVLWRNPATGDTGYWAMNGGTATWQGFGQVSSEWRIAGTGDFNGDFAQDIVWRNMATGDVGFWDLPPGGGGPSWTYLGNVPFEWEIAGTGDANGDSRTDIIWRNTANGDVGYWAMGSTSPGWNYIGGSVLSYRIQGIGDFDGNGRADILWRDSNTGDTGVFLLNAKGQATWQDYGQIRFADEIIGVGDLDGNGTSDILWRNMEDGTTGYWAMDTAARTTWHGLGVTPLDFKVLSVADFNGDGAGDILWRNSSGMTGYWAMYDGLPRWHAMGDSSTQYAVAA